MLPPFGKLKLLNRSDSTCSERHHKTWNAKQMEDEIYPRDLLDSACSKEHPGQSCTRGATLISWEHIQNVCHAIQHTQANAGFLPAQAKAIVERQGCIIQFEIAPQVTGYLLLGFIAWNKVRSCIMLWLAERIRGSLDPTRKVVLKRCAFSGRPPEQQILAPVNQFLSSFSGGSNHTSKLHRCPRAQEQHKHQELKYLRHYHVIGPWS